VRAIAQSTGTTTLIGVIRYALRAAAQEDRTARILNALKSPGVSAMEVAQEEQG
jgi:hypothetical protein